MSLHVLIGKLRLLEHLDLYGISSHKILSQLSGAIFYAILHTIFVHITIPVHSNM